MKKIILALILVLVMALAPRVALAATQRTAYFKIGKSVESSEIQYTINRAPRFVISSVKDYGLAFETFFIHDYLGGAAIHKLAVGDKICFYSHFRGNKRQNLNCKLITFVSAKLLSKTQDEVGRLAFTKMMSSYNSGEATSFLMSCLGTGRKVIGWK